MSPYGSEADQPADLRASSLLPTKRRSSATFDRSALSHKLSPPLIGRLPKGNIQFRQQASLSHTAYLDAQFGRPNSHSETRIQTRRPMMVFSAPLGLRIGAVSMRRISRSCPSVSTW